MVGALLGNKLTAVGAAIVFVLFVVAVFAPALAPYDPHALDTYAVLEAPSAAHPFGTDGIGRDVLSRMIYGARVSLMVGFVAVGIACLIGVVLGSIAGYSGGLLDSTIMRFVDVMLCFPSFFLILAVIAFLDASIWNIMVVIGLTSWMGVCRLVRAEFLSLRQRDFMVAAEGLGARPWRVILSLSMSRIARANMKVMIVTAIGRRTASGAIHRITPARVRASTSIWLYPTPV